MVAVNEQFHSENAVFRSQELECFGSAGAAKC
jgi:hypothetical protein